MNVRECGLLSPLALGLSLGLLTSIAVVSLTLYAGSVGMIVGIVHAIATTHIGFGSVAMVILVGGVSSFLDGFIFGVIWAALYNFFLRQI